MIVVQMSRLHQILLLLITLDCFMEMLLSPWFNCLLMMILLKLKVSQCLVFASYASVLMNIYIISYWLDIKPGLCWSQVHNAVVH